MPQSGPNLGFQNKLGLLWARYIFAYQSLGRSGARPYFSRQEMHPRYARAFGGLAGSEFSEIEKLSAVAGSGFSEVFFCLLGNF